MLALELPGFQPAKPLAAPKVYSPRPYQDAARERIRENLIEDGARSTLVVMATGLGKTVLFAEEARDFDGGVLVLAHRKTLLEQARKTLEDLTGEYVGLEQGENYAGQQRIVVASKDSLHPKRLTGRYQPSDFGLIVVDEAHRSVSESYKHIFEFFKDAKLLGVTATPDRADEKALGEVFETVSYVYEVGDAIGDGWLVPLTTRRVVLDKVNLATIATVAGDFNAGELDEAMQADNEGVVRATLEHAPNLRTLVFTTSVDNAAVLAETFNKAEPGCANYICGEMEEERKAALMRDHKAGRFRVLVNVDVLTEGYDDPFVECIAMARPTKSRIRYAQVIGRGTRALPGVVDNKEDAEHRQRAIAASAKPRCLVLDFVGNCGRHSLVGPEDILGGKYSDEEIAEAKEITEKNPEKATDQALKEAKAALEERRKRKAMEARRFKVVDYKARSFDIDPFAIMGVRGSFQDAGRFSEAATAAQKDALTKKGIEFPDNVSKNAASRLLKNAAERRDKGLATFKQLKVLAKAGIEQKNITFVHASTVIDSLFKSNFKSVSDEALAILKTYKKGRK